AGTVRVKDIVPGPGSPILDWLTAAGNTLYFSANDLLHGYQLWKSDGTDAGTSPVVPMSMSPAFLTNVNGTLFFQGCVYIDGTRGGPPPSGGCELWKSDGTAAGTALVKDIAPFFDSSF